MKRNKKFKLLAVFLTILLVVPLFSDIFSGTTANAATAEEVPSFVEGATIYEPDLTNNGNESGIPAGWLAVPESQVNWIDDTTGWAEYDETKTNTKNSTISESAFTRTATGLEVGLGTGEFGVVFPALKDAEGNAVEDYVYTMTISGVNASGNVAGSFGPITDIGGDEDYVGGTHLMVYQSAASNSYRSYIYWQKKINSDCQISNGADNAIQHTTDGRVTIAVYHCNGTNYYFANGTYIYSQIGKDVYNSGLNGVGMYFCSPVGLVIEDIKVKKIEVMTGLTNTFTYPSVDIRYCDTEGNTTGEATDGLRFEVSVDKTSDLYQYYVPEGTYDVSNENIKFGMLIMPKDLLPTSGVITIDTPMVEDTVMTKIESQDDSKLTYKVSLVNIPESQQGRAYTARAYMKVKNADDTWDYTYAKDTITRSYSRVANLFYEDTVDGKIQTRLDTLFENCSSYYGADANKVTFALFSDFHYRKGTYMSSIADMEEILKRADDANADFIIHAGDFCNDYNGSPELFKAYLNNSYGMPAYGIYGNHELEYFYNSMQLVTPLLNNKNDQVVWGTEDGKIGDGSIGYYYYEVNGFRMICLDTNYSYDAENNVWEHNDTCTSAPVATNKYWHSLGPVQLEWLEETLMDAAEQGIPCVVFSHADLSGVLPYNPSADYKTVQELFATANAKQPGTVLMAINGHIHTNHVNIVDNVLYLDVNTVRNGVWQEEQQDIYTDETFLYKEYDAEGNETSSEEMKLADLSYGKNTWFFKDPLSAIVHISASGRIEIEGMETTWISEVVPNAGFGDGMEPKIVTGTFDIPLY